MDDLNSISRPDLKTLLSQTFSCFLPIVKLALPILILFRLPMAWGIETLNELWVTDKGPEAQLQLLQVATLLELLIGTVVNIAVIKMIAARQEGKILKPWIALKQSLPLWTEGVATLVLLNIILIGLFFLLIIPALIWGIFYCFVLYIVALEAKGGRTALRESKALVQGHWFEVFSYVFLVHVALLIFSYLLNASLLTPIANLISDTFKQNPWQHPINIFTGGLLNFMLDLLSPFAMIFMTLYFLQLKQPKTLQT